MKRAVISVKAEELDDVKKKLEKEIAEEEGMFLEVALLVYGPPDKVEKMGPRAVCSGATSFMIV